MSLVIKHVADLLGMDFRIPSYQRGYRWERKQIEQLLDDLLEFYESIQQAKLKDKENREWNFKHPHERQKSTNNSDQVGFYCLQPLAVTLRAGDGNAYDVIDGQQRLTTIYLILCYLLERLPFPYDDTKSLDEVIYKLSYQTRKEDFFKNKSFKSLNGSDTNIDFYFLSKGYQTIIEWFQAHKKDESRILRLLLPEDYNSDDEDLNSTLQDVRFIWYDTPVTSSISTFNDLNYGKIGLTAAELVKALLFQCDVYEVESREVAKKDAYARSTRWSLMEEELQNKFFWGMLTASNIEKDLHIELLLDFVASDVDKRMGYSTKEGWDSNDSDWVFNVFSKAISDKYLTTEDGVSLPRIIDRIEFLWDEIQRVYSVFRNWYTDRCLYHKIGLLVYLETAFNRKPHDSVIRSLYESYRKGNTKPEFEHSLDVRIGECVKISADITEEMMTEDGSIVQKKRKKLLHEINYVEDANDIRKVLLLFNVQKTMEGAKEETLFPFQDAYKLVSLEHIHPQHLDETTITYDAFKSWFETRASILIGRGLLKKKSSLASAIRNLRHNLQTEESFNSQKQQCLLDLSMVDQEFDELAGMKPEYMHTLYNMALVDISTNAALGNQLMDQKKAVLKTKQEDPNGSYIPIGTWYAFNKYYSDDIKDMKFWSESDRTPYFSAIENVYKSYVK